MMTLDPNFTFSANSLQDYLICPRRFELRYLLKQSWPAAASEPVLEFERHLQLGSHFHQLVYQFFNGIPQDTLLQAAEDPDLQSWFNNFLAYKSKLDFIQTFAELPVRISIRDFQVMAVFDLLARTKNGEVQILDWKTARRIPKKSKLAERVQTWLYPYAALEAASALLPESRVLAENMRMTYLYVHNGKDNAITFNYSQEQHAQNRESLHKLIAEIQAKEAGSFGCTSDKRQCKYCVYRSLCERGSSAGDFNELEDDLNLDQLIENLDFDAQDEIAF